MQFPSVKEGPETSGHVFEGLGHGSGRRGGHGSGWLRVSMVGDLVGTTVVTPANGSSILRFPASSVSSPCDDAFQTRSTLRSRMKEKRNGKMHFALRDHYKGMFALGCYVGFVERWLRKCRKLVF